MSHQIVNLTGLTCEGCVETVTEALTGLPGVQGVEIDLRQGQVSTVSIDTDREVPAAELQAALSLVGAFTVQG